MRTFAQAKGSGLLFKNVPQERDSGYKKGSVAQLRQRHPLRPSDKLSLIQSQCQDFRKSEPATITAPKQPSRHRRENLAPSVKPRRHKFWPVPLGK